MSEELTDSFLLDLLDENKERKSRAKLHLSRAQTQFPTLPKGGPVKWHDTFSPNKSLICTSRMCKCPTVFTFRGIPYCVPHLIVLMNWELMNGRPAGSFKNVDDLTTEEIQTKVLNL